MAISNSRGREAVQPIADEVGAQPATVEEAAEFGEIVFEAVPLHAYTDLPADVLKGKIVVDAANYYPSRDGPFEEIENGIASSELIQRHLPDSMVVKAFNTIQWPTSRTSAAPRGPCGAASPSGSACSAASLRARASPEENPNRRSAARRSEARRSEARRRGAAPRHAIASAA